MRSIYIKAEPIDLVPLETFTCTLDWPHPSTAFIYQIYLDGYLTRAKKCDCPIKTLMESGCQCGGV